MEMCSPKSFWKRSGKKSPRKAKSSHEGEKGKYSLGEKDSQ